ncbi:MAG TPA: rhodanese-like domain-containing protein, partial [Desulfobacterales bacterium]|nr:rhodanese-like domain-containing protein [Desulfobacterales bacterium]
ALGRDLILNPPQKGAPLNTFGYPYAEVGGKPLDFYKPTAFKYHIVSYRVGTAGYALISTAGLKGIIDQDDDTLIFDARSPEEYHEVHVKGALNLPVDNFAAYRHLLPLDRSRPLVFYCNGVKCGKSSKEAKKVLALGYEKVMVYAAGIPVWEEKGMPVYKGPNYEKRIETKKISPAALNKLLNSGADNFTIVDVRDRDEFAAGHIPTAVNIPLASFAAKSAVLDKKKKIIVYCNSGGRSYDAYRKLMKLGYKNIDQAIFADWKAAGLPVGR